MADCKVKPFPAPSICEPCTGTFDLGLAAEHERALFDVIASEQGAQVAGTPIQYYRRVYSRGTKDPLYGEPTLLAWKGPYKLKAMFEAPEVMRENTEQGHHSEWDAVAYLPRALVEAVGMTPPQQGDVFQVWDVPFFNAEGVDRGRVPGAVFAFDVENAVPDGYVLSGPSFVNFKLTLRRRTEFTPERRVAP